MELRKAITASESSICEDGNRSHDPFPFNPREDGKNFNPLDMTEAEGEKTPVVCTPPSLEVEVAKKLDKMEEFDAANSVPATKFLSPNHSPRSTSPQSSTPSSSVFDSNDSNPPRAHSVSPVESCLPDSTTSTSTSPVQDDTISSKTFSIASSKDTGYGESLSSLSRHEDFISSSSLSDSTGFCHSTAHVKSALSPTASVFGSDASSLPPSIPPILSGSSSSVSSFADVPRSGESRQPPHLFGENWPEAALASTKVHFPAQEDFELKFQPGTFPDQFQTQPFGAVANQCPSNSLPNWSAPGNQQTPHDVYIKREPDQSPEAPIDLTSSDYYALQARFDTAASRQGAQPNFGAGFSSGQHFNDFNPPNQSSSASFQMPSVSSSVIVIDGDGIGNGGFGMNPSLPELTGDDLRVLDFIENMDQSGTAISQMPQFVSGKR